MSPLLLLPQELLSEICAYLPLDGLVALKLAHRIVNAQVQINSQSWSEHKVSHCARLAIRSYIAPPDPAPTHEWCILCQKSYPTGMFCSSSSPICNRLSHIRQNSVIEVLKVPPRMCCWHVGRLTRLVSSAPDQEDGWVSCLEVVCMHCGSVQGWKKCECNCDSCAFRTVCTYTRFLNKDTKYKSFTFWRSSEKGDSIAKQEWPQGILYAREVRNDPSAFVSLDSGLEGGLTLIQKIVMEPLRWTCQ